jgi:hypothetical protein
VPLEPDDLAGRPQPLGNQRTPIVIHIATLATNCEDRNYALTRSNRGGTADDTVTGCCCGCRAGDGLISGAVTGLVGVTVDGVRSSGAGADGAGNDGTGGGTVDAVWSVGALRRCIPCNVRRPVLERS